MPLPPLRSIVYVSTAVRAMDEAELQGLLVEARDLNRESGVTGVLIYSGGNFMQYFEGSDEAVVLTYQRIRDSRRHTGIIELIDEHVAERSFASWEMGFRQVKDSELLLLSGARWQAVADAAPARPSPGMALLLNFWRNAQR